MAMTTTNVGPDATITTRLTVNAIALAGRRFGTFPARNVIGALGQSAVSVAGLSTPARPTSPPRALLLIRGQYAAAAKGFPDRRRENTETMGDHLDLAPGAVERTHLHGAVTDGSPAHHAPSRGMAVASP